MSIGNVSLLSACSEPTSSNADETTNETELDASSISAEANHAVDVPIPGVSQSWQAEFNRGDPLFDLVLRDADGLGPLYTRQACSSCHDGALRGTGFVQKMSAVQADGITPASDQSQLPFGHTVHPFTAGGATTPILAPSDGNVRLSTRFGPPVLGRGYLEAILDDEIVAAAADQASTGGGIHGRVNHVVYASQPNADSQFHDHQPGDLLIGRFGVKARVATLDDFAADALQGDLGITSPLRPSEIPNPDGQLDDSKPGIDATFDDVNRRANYTRLLAIPPRRLPTGNGQALFARVQCANCHVPSLRTRPDYPIEVLANIDAPVYTDLLLHDMGDDLADGLGETDGEAGPRDWRTAPLIGLKYLTTFLHDARAKTIRDAVLMHDSNGSEAHGSITSFLQLSEGDQQTLLNFVEAL
jgi:CxxC motif-containing protein (DUF1111 family)